MATLNSTLDFMEDVGRIGSKKFLKGLDFIPKTQYNSIISSKRTIAIIRTIALIDIYNKRVK